jgi:hypothetical protein
VDFGFSFVSQIDSRLLVFLDVLDLGFGFLKDLDQWFFLEVGFWFFLDFNSFISGFLWTVGFGRSSIKLDDIKVQLNHSQCKRINAIFPCFVKYGRDRRTTIFDRESPRIFLDAS